MADQLVYHWKHGWIPLTHAAALAKAKGDHKLAERLVPTPAAKRARRTPQHIIDYHAAKQEQARRFEAHVGGGISIDDTHTQEYRDYFGVGDHSSGGKVENLLTYRDHLRQLSATKADEAARNKSYTAGVVLGKQHARASLPTHVENAQYDQAAATVAHEDHFDQGYSDGIAAAYEQQHAAKARRAATMNSLIRNAAQKRRAS